ncbi:MAG: RecX family transcriptional regulator [Gammaproteobacteria bacterium]|nr:RecX family transcriptional regulator [Gammaproteobacteria bacterium]
MRYFLDSIKKKNRRYEIVINDESFKTTYKIREDLLIEMKFLSPKEIKEEEYKLFLSKLPLDSLIYEGEKYSDKKLRTSKEVKDHLKEITNDESMINEVVEVLKKENLINDSSYKKAYLEYAIYTKRDGRVKISNDLIKLGLNSSFDYDKEALKENITLLSLDTYFLVNKVIFSFNASLS